MDLTSRERLPLIRLSQLMVLLIAFVIFVAGVYWRQAWWTALFVVVAFLVETSLRFEMIY